MNTKKNIFIGIGVFVLMVVAFWGYVYWNEGTPEYSFEQMQKALKDHDTVSFKRYFDTDAVFVSYWPRVVARLSQGLNSENSISQQIQISLLNSQATTTKADFDNLIYEKVSGKESGTPSDIKQTSWDAILNSKPSFEIKSQGVATADITYENYSTKNQENYPIYKFRIIMERQSDRRWKITDIQGREDISVDGIKNNDLKNIGSLVGAYLNKKQKNSLTSENWRNVLGSFANENGGISLPEDPLISYSDKNKYDFAIQNGDSSEAYAYVVRAKLSTVNSGAFKSVYGQQNLTYSELVSKISGRTNKILGIDCNAPAYCYIGYGLSSDWSKAFK